MTNSHLCWKDCLLGPRPSYMLHPLFLNHLDVWKLRLAIKRSKMKKSSNESGLTAELLKATNSRWFFCSDTWSFQCCFAIQARSWNMVYNSLLSECCLKNCVQFRRVSSDLLQAVGFSTKCLHIWSLDVWRRFWSPKNPRNNMVFNQAEDWKNICWQRTVYWNKPAAAGIAVWIVSLDLSKAFDRIHWPTLWVALREPGVPEHLVRLLENAYAEQFGGVMGEWGKSRSFSITGGVRQGCVLMPRLFRFSAVLQCALQQWRTEIGHAGFDLGDNLGNLVDPCFADDILLFANSGPEVAQGQICESSGKNGFATECRQNGYIDKRGVTTQYACDKG